MHQFRSWLRRKPLWVSTLIGMSLSGGGSGFFEYWWTGGVVGWRPVVVALIGAFIMTVWTALMEKSVQPEPPVQPERIFSNRSPEELVALIKGLTSVEAEAATELHIGTWLRVHGTVFDVEKLEDRAQVLLSRGDGSGVFLHFDKSWWNRVKLLRVKEKISVIGKIRFIDRNMIHLENCELPKTDS